MTLRDRMVYAGIRNSKRFARLSWFERDFFMGLLLVADDYGRFEAEPDTLRTVLYGPLLSKVTMRDVQGALMRFAATETGLVKLYTVKARGYGKVHNFRQLGLAKRRALYPDEDGKEAEPDLFALESGPPEGRKEGNPPLPPAAAGGQIAAPFFPNLQTAVKVRRVRSPGRRLDSQRDELAQVETELTELLYPGGTSYKIEPTGDKRVRYDKLMQRRSVLKELIPATEKELAQ